MINTGTKVHFNSKYTVKVSIFALSTLGIANSPCGRSYGHQMPNKLDLGVIQQGNPDNLM